jgi:CelD/BcsL family acetyltransferase involved in cellulose biosynthesis
MSTASATRDPPVALNHLVPPADREETTLFASRTWLNHWLAAFGEKTKSGWWQTQTAGGPVEIAYVLQDRRLGPLLLRVAAAAANAHTPRFDSCGSGAPKAGHLLAMMEDLDVSAMIFPYVSRQARLARTLAASADLRCHVDFCEASLVVDCTGDFQQYLASRGKTRRTSWLYYQRRALKNGCTLRELSRWQEITPFFDEILAVEASGWKGEAGTAIAQHAQVRKFYASVFEALADEGKLRVFLLMRGEKIIAFQVCTLHRGTLSCVKIGYREEFAKESPGQVLQLMIVNQAFDQPDVQRFDQLGPASDTKMKWATDVDELTTLYIFRPTLAGALARFRWQYGPMIKERLRRPTLVMPTDAERARRLL